MAAAAAAEEEEGSSGAVDAAPRVVGLLYDNRMCAHAMPDGKEHDENPERLRAIWRKLADEGIASRCLVMMAQEAPEKSIASVHTKKHIKLIKNISSKSYSQRNRTANKYNSIYFNEGSSQSAFLAAGSVIEVSEKVASGHFNSAIALVRPPGHHAERNEAMGFCLLNNVAIGVDHLLNQRPDLDIKKVLVLDWDAHHGNGTQKKFYRDPRVLVFSVHRYDDGNFYPYKKDASHGFIGKGAGVGYNINVPWKHGGCGDADYLAVWTFVLLPVLEAFDPDIIFVSAGFDSALGDLLGGCCITPNGYALLLTKLLGFAKGRIVMALEGGYDVESLANSVAACAKVLLGDIFEFNAPEMPPFESTWRIIQMVRDKLKEYWPVLSSKLPEDVPLRSVPSNIQLNVEPLVAPSDGTVPATGTIQNLDENEISQEQAADAEQPLNQNDQTEEQEDDQHADEIGLSQEAPGAAENTQDTQDTPDSSDGVIQLKLIVPTSYQGISMLQSSDIHGFATANELTMSINANDDCVNERQVVGLLHNFSLFQLQSNDLPDEAAIQKGAVITISEDARALYPVTVDYSTVGKILKEHGPKKLQISGINIDKFWVKGNLWTRNRYTIDNTCHVYEWSVIRSKEQVVSRRPRVSYADLIASNDRVIEAGANVVQASSVLADAINAASMNITNSVSGLATLLGEFQSSRVT